MTDFQNKSEFVAVQLQTTKRVVLQIKNIPKGLKVGEARLEGKNCVFLQNN